jgi:hypothetical protein
MKRLIPMFDRTLIVGYVITPPVALTVVLVNVQRPRGSLMPICTAVLTAALFAGPANMPPDPAPFVTKAVAGKIGGGPTRETQQAIYPKLVTIPAPAGSEVPAEGSAPQSPQLSPLTGTNAKPDIKTDTKADTKADGRTAPEAVDSAAKPADASAAQAPLKLAVRPAAQPVVKAAVKPAAQAAVKPAAQAAVKPATKQADMVVEKKATTTSDMFAVPLIDPETHDVVIRPVLASGKPGQVSKAFTFRPLKGVQVSKSYPAMGQSRRQAAQHPRQQVSRGDR